MAALSRIAVVEALFYGAAAANVCFEPGADLSLKNRIGH